MTPHFQFFASSQIIFRRASAVLLMRRCNTGWMDGWYGLAAGHIEAGETALEAARREAHEEAGIVLALADLRPVHTMHRHNPNDSTYFDIFFEVRSWHGEPTNAEPDKCDAVVWAPLTQLPDNTIPHVRSALALVEQGVTYSEFGWQAGQPARSTPAT